MNRQTDRQRKMDRQTDRQRQRQADVCPHWHLTGAGETATTITVRIPQISIEGGREGNRQRDRQIDRQ